MRFCFYFGGRTKRRKKKEDLVYFSFIVYVYVCSVP